MAFLDMFQVKITVYSRWNFFNLWISGRFPKDRTGRPDHGQTTLSGNEMGFFQEV